MKLKQRLFASVFLSLFVYNIVGYYAVFLMVQYSHHQEVKRALKGPRHGALEVIEISKKDMDNHPHFTRVNEREFLYKGSMYDIVRTVESGDSVYFYCMNDKKETRMFAELKKHAGSHDQAPTGTTKHVVKKLAQDYFCDPVPAYAFAEGTDLSAERQHILYSSPYGDLFSPPPEQA